MNRCVTGLLIFPATIEGWSVQTSKTVQLGWPIGMPVVRKLDAGLWEIRIDLGDTIARIIFFTVVGSDMVLLHGFIKKSQKNTRVGHGYRQTAQSTTMRHKR